MEKKRITDFTEQELKDFAKECETLTDDELLYGGEIGDDEDEE